MTVCVCLSPSFSPSLSISLSLCRCLSLCVSLSLSGIRSEQWGERQPAIPLRAGIPLDCHERHSCWSWWVGQLCILSDWDRNHPSHATAILSSVSSNIGKFKASSRQQLRSTPTETTRRRDQPSPHKSSQLQWQQTPTATQRKTARQPQIGVWPGPGSSQPPRYSYIFYRYIQYT